MSAGRRFLRWAFEPHWTAVPRFSIACGTITVLLTCARSLAEILS